MFSEKVDNENQVDIEEQIKVEKKKKKSDRDYQIRYGIIPANLISDKVIVKNPNYGEPIGEWGSRPVTPSAHQMKREGQFYLKLEKSILKEGIRNPIFCNCFEEGTFCRYGTSRLWLAKKHKLEVPVIIADYTGEWKDLELLVDKNDVLDKFRDKPEVLELNKKEMRFDGCPHTHL